ncbi:DUF418 domain-containing protein [Asticcacaulis endophyticus]|uniref:Transporter n=1 Tax=Asticcacaulis endophyticus TaxID=1395890 RepID=A0A918PRL0_9CAUL|nr:DUF418 domain-containing protein [Asticcacaulis endophyticus]GGZ19626.1 transporter [Asticcacaulis endophyticus]
MPGQITPVARNEAVDVLRAFAIFGVFAVHIADQFELYYAHMTPGPLTGFVLTYIMGKSFSLLALCFGLSFFVLMDREAHKGGDFSGRFAWRMVVLAIIGVAHSALYRGDVLTVLAPIGLVLIPFHRVRQNWVLVAIAAILILQPFIFYQIFSAVSGADWANAKPNFWNGGSFEAYKYGTFIDVIRYNLFEGQYPKWWFFLETGRVAQIAGLFLIGMVLGRIGFFDQPQRYATARRIWLVILAAVSAGLIIYKPALIALAPTAQSPVMAGALSNMIVSGWTDLTLMGVYMLVILELFYGFAGPALRVLVPAGRMTLSLYVFQAVVWVPVYYGFGLGGWEWLTPPVAMLWGAAFFVAEIAFAHLWLKRFYYGPLEWLWRAATQMSVNVPFRRKAEVRP